MTNKIIYLMILILCIQTVTANIDAEIVLITNGTVETDLYCYANNCTTNLYGGNLELDNETDYTINDYDLYHTTINNKRTGLSLNKLISMMGGQIKDYMSYNKPSHITSSWKFWSMLDSVFVNHNEFSSTFHNTKYNGDEIDELKAKNELLVAHLGLKFDEDVLECRTGINKAKRINGKVITKNGFIIDIKQHGEICFKID